MKPSFVCLCVAGEASAGTLSCLSLRAETRGAVLTEAGMEEREREGRREKGREFRGWVFPSLLVLVTTSVCRAFPVSHRHSSIPVRQAGQGLFPFSGLVD